MERTTAVIHITYSVPILKDFLTVLSGFNDLHEIVMKKYLGRVGHTELIELLQMERPPLELELIKVEQGSWKTVLGTIGAVFSIVASSLAIVDHFATDHSQQSNQQYIPHIYEISSDYNVRSKAIKLLTVVHKNVNILGMTITTTGREQPIVIKKL